MEWEKSLVNAVELRIGYTFRNKNLLFQAFTRKSYSEENGGENNEVLEFVGDTALNLAVVRFLTQKYGYIDQENNLYGMWGKGEFACDCTEGELTELKKEMVCKKSLAQAIDGLQFAEYLRMGRGDMKRKIQNMDSVKEDLFEAILGAVAIDTDWKLDTICDVAGTMLTLDLYVDEEANYVRQIRDWEYDENGRYPVFEVVNGNSSYTYHYRIDNLMRREPIGGSSLPIIKYACFVKIQNETLVFRGYGSTRIDAQNNACREAYDYLAENDMLHTMRNEIDEPDESFAINQLEILARRGYFSIPTYSFTEMHDEDGNPLWKAKCFVEEYKKYFTVKSSSKKDAKKKAAYKMLNWILEKEN